MAGRSGWGWTLSLLLAAALWLLVADSVPGSHWGWWPRPWRSGCAIAPYSCWPHRQSTSQNGTRQLLLLCWGVGGGSICCSYRTVGAGDDPWLVRPDVVDGFPPIAGGLGLRTWLGQGLTDPHHPAATVTVLVLSCRPCCWVGRFVPGSARSGWWGVVARPALAPVAGEWTPPRWLDAVLRGQKFLVLGFCSSSSCWRYPPPPCPATCQPLPSGGGHEDGGLLLQPDPDLGPVPWLGAAAHRHLPAGFCRYLCPYGAGWPCSAC